MKISNIIIHCSDSAFGCTNTIRQWHLAKGWKDIGYHYVILNGCPTASVNKGVGDPYHRVLDGSIEIGRYLDDDGDIEVDEIGSHTLGYNDKSVGICLIGQRMTTPPLYQQAKGFSKSQMFSLTNLVSELVTRYNIPVDNVLGHYETESGKAQGKTCPNIDMPWFRESIIRERIGGGV
jgi:hypothetical protein